MEIAKNQIAKTKKVISNMAKSLFTSIVFLCLMNISGFAQVNIIPKPNEIKTAEGKCNYKKGISIKILRGDESTKLIQKHLTDFLSENKITVSNTATTVVSINLQQTKPTDSVNLEAYTLNITANNIAITSYGNAGLFYGLQSLFQLIKSDSNKILPCMEIKDQPAFGYRGFQLDASQQYFKSEVIKKYIDAIASLKINHFVWKLADEKNWRIEIKKYPDLYKIEDAEQIDYYTQDDMKQIVQYAAERFVTVIPEINFALISETEDTTFQYKKNIVDEILALFPSKYFHVNNPIFVNDAVVDYLKANHKKIISQDLTLSENTILQSYKNANIGIGAANTGFPVIMSPKNLCSLDNYPNWDDSKLSKSMTFLPIDKVYAFDPIAKIKDAKTQQNILGAQANVDTKFLNNPAKLAYNIYPRIYALAECFWTKKSNKTSFKDFSKRLENIGYPGQITGKINMVKFK